MRAGNTLAASKALSISQPTVARRIEVLEVALGIELFDRRRTGYVPTEVARQLLGEAGEAAGALDAVEALAAQMRRDLIGTVRVTGSAQIADLLLSPALLRFHEKHRDLKLEVVAEDRYSYLAKGEADVALRIFTRQSAIGACRPPNLCRSMERLLQPQLCCGAGRAAPQRGLARACADHGGARDIPGADEWFYRVVSTAEVAQFRNHVAGMWADVEAGHGVSVMSDLLAACDPDLVHCFTPDIERPHELCLPTNAYATCHA